MAAPQLSPDGRWWWDGAAWRQVSGDRRSWWDGAAWRLLPQAAAPPTVAPQFSPDGRFQWNGAQWIPANVPRSGGWWWNGAQWVPARSPVQRAFRRLWMGLAFRMFTCLVVTIIALSACGAVLNSMAHH